MTKKEILERLEKDGIKSIQLQFINLNGQLHAVEKPIHQIEKIMDGEIMIDGSSIKGYSTITTSDLFLKPDWNTYLHAKFLATGGYGNVARVLCSVLDKNGKPFSGDPRTILSSVETKWNKKGYTLASAFEAEFFLMKRDEHGKLVPADNTGYFGVSPLDTADGIKREMVAALEDHGFEIEAFHKEVAQGQHEINFKYSSALEQADKIVTFKWIVRSIAARHGLVASFMPKPIKGINGSGMHTNISVAKDGKNIFYRKDVKSINIEHQKFVSGLIRRAKEIAAITNPTVNSYKRLIPGFEAPNCIAWSDSNRSAMFRIPASVGHSTRIEQRNVDPAANPYLALALIFEAGFEGLESKAKPFEPVYDNLFKKTRAELKALGVDLLPDNLGQSLALTSQSSFVKKVLGDHTFEKFLKEKYTEWDEYRQIVHTWEIEKYTDY